MEECRGIKDPLNFFFALSFELKSGQINLDDIAARGTGMAVVVARVVRARADEKKEKDAIERAGEKYPELDLRDTILSKKT